MDKKELQQMDRKTRKFITVYGGLRPRSCIGKLYIPLSGGGRGLVSVEDYVKEDKCYLQKYATQSKETIVKTESAELNLEKYLANVSKKENKEN